MKKTFGVAALLGLVATSAMATSAFAQCGALGSGVLIDFDEGFAYESIYTPLVGVNSGSQPGSQMTAVGKVVLFCAPLLDKHALISNPAYEYTFIINATSTGTLTAPFGTSGTKWDTDYTGGTFSIYEGTPRNAPAASAMPASPPNGTVPSTFTDGTAILSGVFDTFHIQTTRSSAGTWGSSVRGDYRFTGGTLYSRVGGGSALFVGLWCSAGVGNGHCDIPAGYTAKPNAAWNSPQTTDATSSTWGAIKQLYR